MGASKIRVDATRRVQYFNVLAYAEPRPPAPTRSSKLQAGPSGGPATSCRSNGKSTSALALGRSTGTFYHPGDDGVVIVDFAPDKRQEFGGKDIVLFQEGPVATAGIHERRWELAAEFGFCLRDDAGKPGDAAGGGGFWWKGILDQHAFRGAALLNVEKIIAADDLDREGVVVAGFAALMMVLGIVVKVLRRDPVGGEESLFIGGEIGVGAGSTGAVERDRFVVERAEIVSEIVVAHSSKESDLGAGASGRVG